MSKKSFVEVFGFERTGGEAAKAEDSIMRLVLRGLNDAFRREQELLVAMKSEAEKSADLSQLRSLLKVTREQIETVAVAEAAYNDACRLVRETAPKK